MKVTNRISETKEVRHIHIDNLEVRTIEGSDNKVVGGYVNQFNKQSLINNLLL